METAASELPGNAARDSAYAGRSAQDMRREWARSAPWLLRQASRRYGSAVAARLRDSDLGGLPRAGYWLLMALASGATDATQLVEAIGVTKQAVSKVIDVLVGEELVVRRTNEEDRRRTDLELTSRGRRTVEAIRSAVRSTEHAFVEEVGAEAWETTVATLATLASGRPDDALDERRNA